MDLGYRVGVLEGHIAGINDRLGSIEERLNSMDRRFDGIDQRFEGMDKRFDAMDRRLDSIENRLKPIDDIRVDIAKIHERLNHTPTKAEMLLSMFRTGAWVVGLVATSTVIITRWDKIAPLLGL